jgi:hypothetical protein
MAFMASRIGTIDLGNLSASTNPLTVGLPSRPVPMANLLVRGVYPTIGEMIDQGFGGASPPTLQGFGGVPPPTLLGQGGGQSGEDGGGRVMGFRGRTVGDVLTRQAGYRGNDPPGGGQGGNWGTGEIWPPTPKSWEEWAQEVLDWINPIIGLAPPKPGGPGGAGGGPGGGRPGPPAFLQWYTKNLPWLILLWGTIREVRENGPDFIIPKPPVIVPNNEALQNFIEKEFPELVKKPKK